MPSRQTNPPHSIRSTLYTAHMSTSPNQPDLPTAIPELAIEQEGFDAPSPSLVLLNDALATDLGFHPAWLRSEEGLRFLTGHGTETPGSLPVATAYAGHQFGNFAGLLGDGRALLLATAEGRPGLTGLKGQVGVPDKSTPTNAAASQATQLYEIQSKGTGPTPFSRGGDGKATLTSALREYLISEAMFALGVPTTRALAVIATGEDIYRGSQIPFDEQPPTSELQPGGIVVRVATSHLRVGTFELVARSGSDTMPRLINFAAARHRYDESAKRVLAGVVKRQADLVAQWMTCGFVHGVMNTDNASVSGETIDYGPCAFLDAHDPRAVFSSIDSAGRYAFGAQPTVAGWNLGRLAEALLQSLEETPDEALNTAREILGSFADEFASALTRHWLPKIGLPSSLADDPSATKLLRQWQSLLAKFGPDHTNVHRALISLTVSTDGNSLAEMSVARDEGQWPDAVAEWARKWESVREKKGVSKARARELMEAANPVYIPRNHLVTEALEQAGAGDTDLYLRLLKAVTHPFEAANFPTEFTLPAPAELGSFHSYCGT